MGSPVHTPSEVPESGNNCPGHAARWYHFQEVLHHCLLACVALCIKGLPWVLIQGHREERSCSEAVQLPHQGCLLFLFQTELVALEWGIVGSDVVT